MKKNVFMFALFAATAAHAEPFLHRHPVDKLAHAAGGAAIAHLAAHADMPPPAAIAIAAAVGAAKEASDRRFSVPDALAWPAGAFVYRGIVFGPRGIFWTTNF